jgi:hypothetical protein
MGIAGGSSVKSISKGKQPMSVLDTLRKGLKFFLMSFGISSPEKKPQPAAAPADPKSKPVQ